MNIKLSDNKLLKICAAAMFAALICVATMLIRVPTPTGGYVNLGDCFILVAAFVLGPYYGFAAGAIGSAAADMFAGYMQYVPGTFVIKGLIALAAALIVRLFSNSTEVLRFVGLGIGAVVGEIIMVGGYYLYEATLLSYGFAGAFASVWGNVVQGVFGAVLGTALVVILTKTNVLAKIGAYVH